MCSDTPGDVLWGINDVEEDEDEAAEDISELPKSLDWISLKKGYESYRKVLERIALHSYGEDTALKVEQTIAIKVWRKKHGNGFCLVALARVICRLRHSRIYTNHNA